MHTFKLNTNANLVFTTTLTLLVSQWKQNYEPQSFLAGNNSASLFWLINELINWKPSCSLRYFCFSFLFIQNFSCSCHSSASGLYCHLTSTLCTFHADFFWWLMFISRFSHWHWTLLLLPFLFWPTCQPISIHQTHLSPTSSNAQLGFCRTVQK